MKFQDLFAMLLIAVLTKQICPISALTKMKLAYTWDQITFPINSSEAVRLEDEGIYCPGCSVIFDAAYDTERNRIFVSMPHILYGSVCTLATIEEPEVKVNPQLNPYPDWSWHANYSGCDGITSVFRIHADNCGRLWVIDSGDNLQLAGFIQECPPQLLVFNLTTDELIVRHRFPMGEEACPRTLMLTVITEHMDDECSDDVYAYIADAGDFNLKVYHLGMDRSWAVRGDWFYPEVTARDFSIYGVEFAKMIGVLGLALSPCLDADCDRFLFFHSFTGFIEGRVRTSILRNESLFLNGNDGARNDIDIIGRHQLQSVAQSMSDNGYLFFGQVGDNSLFCWNYRTPYNTENFHVVEKDEELISIPMGVNVFQDASGEEIITLVSNNIQILFTGNFTRNTTYPINIMYAKVNELVAGSRCEK